MADSTMRAVVLRGHGGTEQLEYRDDWPRPVAGQGEVLVRVLACGMNNTDINTRTAWYSRGNTSATSGAAGAGAEEGDATWGGNPLTFPRIQGADVAGVVEEVGQGADPSLAGRRCLIYPWLIDWENPDNIDKAGYFGSECDGGFAEYTKVDTRQIFPIDSKLSDTELATFATSSMTAANMLRRAQVEAGDTVLVTGASGGVGTALVQMVRSKGGTPIAQCSAGKEDAMKALGAAAVLPRDPANLGKEVEVATGSASVDVVADVVGGPSWGQLIDVLRPGGRYVCSGAIAGPIVELDLRLLYLKDLTLVGATVAPPEVFSDLIQMIEQEALTPVLAGVYPLERLVEAQQAFLEKKHVGSYVVDVAGAA